MIFAITGFCLLSAKVTYLLASCCVACWLEFANLFGETFSVALPRISE